MPVVSKPVYRICDTNDDSRRYNTQVHLNLTDQKIKINSALLRESHRRRLDTRARAWRRAERVQYGAAFEALNEGSIAPPLTVEQLAVVSPEAAKNMIGERLYPLIKTSVEDGCDKITGMLLDGMETAELLHLLDDEHALLLKILEATQELSRSLFLPLDLRRETASRERYRRDNPRRCATHELDNDGIYIYIKDNKIYAIAQPIVDEYEDILAEEKSKWNRGWSNIGIRKSTYNAHIYDITAYFIDFRHIGYIRRTPPYFISNILKPYIKNHIIDIIEQINRADQE
jgi:hypothetical protein